MTAETMEDLRNARRGEIIERLLATQEELARHLGPETPRQTWRTMASRIAGELSALYLHMAGEELAFDPPNLRSVITARRKLKDAGIAEPTFMAQMVRSAEAAAGAAVDRGEAWPKERDRWRFALLVGMHVDYAAALSQLWEDPAAHASTVELGHRVQEIAAALARELDASHSPANDITEKDPTHEPA
ncbi:hypothetical protein [Thalassobaculum sp.]|uniref:hypothetical protein n=1 Tax=Thalassobaculum sp. TaxID=2022740 RepID=UPI003B5BD46A